MEATKFISLKAIERYMLFLFVFLPGAHEAKGLFKIMARKIRKGDAFSASRLMRQFAGRGLLRKAGHSSDEYLLDATFTRAQIADLVREAAAGKWWPSQAELDAGAEAGDGRRYYGYYRSRGTSDFEFARMCLVRDFMCGPADAAEGPNAVVARVLKGTNRAKLTCAVAEWTRTVLPEGPDFASRTWSYADDAVLPAWLTLAFLKGLVCGAELAFIASNIARVESPNETLHRAYAALRVWRGEAETLLEAPGRGAYGNAYEPMIHAAKGSYAAADKQILWCGGEKASYSADAAALESAAWFFLCGFIAASTKPDKIPRMRPIAIFRNLEYSMAEYTSVSVPEEAFLRRVATQAARCATAWKSVLDGKGEMIARTVTADAVSPVEALLMAFDFRFLPVGRAARRGQAELLARAAKRFADAGYRLVAISLLELLRGGYSEAEYAPLMASLREEAVPFLTVTDVAPEWKNALVLLEKALPRRRAASSTSAAAVRIVWHVALESRGAGVYEVLQICPAVRSATDPEDGSADGIFSWYDFNIARQRERMTDADYLLAKTLEASDGEADDEAVELLCGMPNLMRHDELDPYGERYGRKRGKFVLAPLKIVRGACRLETTVTEDGGLALSVPPWLAHLDAREDVFLHALPNGEFECLMPTNAEIKLIDAFSGFGPDQRLVLPRAAMRDAEPVLARLQEAMPFAEREVAGGQAALRRVPAEARVVARLVYAEGVLDIRAAVKPLAENPAMAFDPGAGAAERLVAGAGGSYVLVRDLAAEKANLATVVAALAGSEAFFDGRCAWRFDDLEAALGALAALKASEPPVEMEWPDERRLKVSSAPKSGVTLASTRTAEDWFRVEGSFQLDDGRVLGIVQLLEAAKARQGNFIRLSDGDFVALTATMAREIDALNAAGRRKGDAIEIVRAAVPMLDKVFDGSPEALALPGAMAETAKEIRAALAERPAVPRTLAAELRPYQKDGYRWLSRLARCGFGTCLADDMGLGKTLQVMTLLLERAKDGPSLVLAPSSVCGNWRSEIRRFAPTLEPVLAQEDGAWASAAAGGVVIASYGYLLFHEEAFDAVEWNGVVLDEAQAIKNDASKRAKAVKRLKARFRIAATGTPVENRLGEMWSLMDFLNPGLLGSAAGFTSRFTENGKATPALKRLVKPLVLRRLKGDVLDDLPPKTEITLPITLGTAERTAYEGCRRHALAVLAEKGEGADGPNRMSILAELTRLRRFCCHPSLVLPGEGLPSAKLEALVELLEGLRDGHHRALVFSQFTDYLAIVRKALDARGWSHLYLDGATPTVERGKLVSAFQGGEGDFFLISLKAGGTGLNLTAADYVILLDPWWNPAVENQAADRAHRIGQDKPVTIYRLIASDTVEERVIELHREKQAIAEDVLEGTGSTSLTPAQLMRLFG